MKCNYYLHFFIILSIIEILSSIKSKSKIKNKSRIRNKEKGKFLNNKKNGPISWDVFQENEALNSLLKNEREEINGYIRPNLNRIPRNYPNKSYFSLTNAINNDSMNFLKVNENISANQKSKTFRSVGPYDDSTINKNGIKYSKIYHNKSNRNLNPGFYGSSRLTRF